MRLGEICDVKYIECIGFIKQLGTTVHTLGQSYSSIPLNKYTDPFYRGKPADIISWPSGFGIWFFVTFMPIVRNS